MTPSLPHHEQPLFSCLRKLSEEWNNTHELYNAQRPRTLTLLETVNRERLYSYFTCVDSRPAGRSLGMYCWLCDAMVSYPPPPPTKTFNNSGSYCFAYYLLTQQTTLFYESYLKHKNSFFTRILRLKQNKLWFGKEYKLFSVVCDGHTRVIGQQWI